MSVRKLQTVRKDNILAELRQKNKEEKKTTLDLSEGKNLRQNSTLTNVNHRA